MIIDFKVKNYRSFAKEQTLSMVASSNKELKENYCEVGDFKLLKSAGIYGANASGKSNLIRAIKDMRAIILKSATIEPNTPKPIKPFLLNSKLAKKVTMFEITFIHDGIRYQYGFKTGKITIREEWLIAYPKNRSQIWFQRIYDKRKRKSIIEFGPSFKGEKQRIKRVTRNDSLFLSTAAQFGHTALTEIYDWFKVNLIIINTNDMTSPPKDFIFEQDNKNIVLWNITKTELTKLLNAADLGIEGIRISPIDINKYIENLPDDFPEKLRKKIINEWKENPPIQINTIHRMSDTGNEVIFDLDEDESDGTKRFFDLLGPWLFAIKYNATIIVDEIESSLHPLLSRALIKMINDSSRKNGSPQLIFATHDVTLLSNDLLRRDQIWFVEKNKIQASELTPLLDYKPRKGEAIFKGYMSGRYHGVPNIKDFAFEKRGK
ncbi:MAG: ATP-binding protein [candidate division Zixibacteria bacterium]